MANLITKRGQVYYANCNYKGVRLRDSLKTTDLEKAIERLLELQLQVREGVYQRRKTKFKELASKYSPKIDSEAKLSVVKNHLIPEFGGKTLSECDVKKWADRVANERPRETAKLWIRVAKDVGLPVPEDIKFNEQKRWNDTQILEEEEVLNVIRNYMPQKYQSICLVACYSLLRLSNLVNLRKRDVDFKEGITVIQGRSKKHSVFIPMSDKLRAAFDSIKIWPMRDDDLWFPEITAGALSASAMRKFHKAGIPWGSFHQFRHFGACYLLNKGVPIETVSKWLGHKSIVTTMIYARVKRETLKDSAKAFAQIRTK